MECVVISAIHLGGKRVEPGAKVTLDLRAYERLAKEGCVRTVREHETLTQAAEEAERFSAEAAASAEKERQAMLEEARAKAEAEREAEEARAAEEAEREPKTSGRRRGARG